MTARKIGEAVGEVMDNPALAPPEAGPMNITAVKIKSSGVQIVAKQDTKEGKRTSDNTWPGEPHKALLMAVQDLNRQTAVACGFPDDYALMVVCTGIDIKNTVSGFGATLYGKTTVPGGHVFNFTAPYIQTAADGEDHAGALLPETIPLIRKVIKEAKKFSQGYRDQVDIEPEEGHNDATEE